MLDKFRNRYQEVLARRAEGENGFTLIELLVVVVIIGILVAIAIPLYLHFENGAKTSSAESDVHSLVNTIKLCQSDNGGTLPGALSGTSGSLTFLAATGGAGVCSGDGFTLSGDNTASYTVNADGSFTVAVTNPEAKKVATFTSANGQTSVAATS